MVKVTLNDNFVPSTRDAWVLDHPLDDLTHHYEHARKLIRATSQFFHLRRDAVIFSGCLREGNASPFTINLWNEGEVVRRLSVDKLGYGGALHAELAGSFEEVVGWDLLGAISLGEGSCLLAQAG